MTSSKRTAKVAARATARQDAIRASQLIPADLQQRVLDVFRDACTEQSPSELVNNLQAVKTHLYNRDFALAFSSDAYLWSYVMRWSPSRALAYLEILRSLESYMMHCPDVESHGPVANDSEAGVNDLGKVAGNGKEKGLTMTCLGGGAGAEFVACAAWLGTQTKADSGNESLRLRCIDIADWSKILLRLETAIKESAMLPVSAMSYDFLMRDLHGSDFSSVKSCVSTSSVVTMMFTLNELYTNSLPKTQSFLTQLTMAAKPGTLLLVVDSPGSYSAVKINGHEKRYPMQWLLDYTLLGGERATRPVGADEQHWVKLVSEDSKWFRIPAGLRYQVELENMRYQIHLYKRL